MDQFFMNLTIWNILSTTVIDIFSLRSILSLSKYSEKDSKDVYHTNLSKRPQIERQVEQLRQYSPLMKKPREISRI